MFNNIKHLKDTLINPSSSKLDIHVSGKLLNPKYNDSLKMFFWGVPEHSSYHGPIFALKMLSYSLFIVGLFFYLVYLDKYDPKPYAFFKGMMTLSLISYICLVIASIFGYLKTYKKLLRNYYSEVINISLNHHVSNRKNETLNRTYFDNLINLFHDTELNNVLAPFYNDGIFSTLKLESDSDIDTFINNSNMITSIIKDSVLVSIFRPTLTDTSYVIDVFFKKDLAYKNTRIIIHDDVTRYYINDFLDELYNIMGMLKLEVYNINDGDHFMFIDIRYNNDMNLLIDKLNHEKFYSLMKNQKLLKEGKTNEK